MGCNLDIANPDVRKELLYWGEWYNDLTGLDGFRFDAVKHFGSDFFVEWLNHIRSHTGRDLFAVGEYWSGINDALIHCIEIMGHLAGCAVGCIRHRICAYNHKCMDGTNLMQDPALQKYM